MTHKTSAARALLFALAFAMPQTGLAVDATYYSDLDGKSGADLFDAIHTVAKVGYGTLSYKGLWTAYGTTDLNSSGKIWDMYGGCEFTYSSDQCGNYTNECDCYNREHSIPKSWFGGSEGNDTPGTDIFHVVPTDGKVNGMRSNYAFGEVSSADYSYNGSQLGSAKSITTDGLLGGSVTTTYSSTVFEPIDEYKGDFARGYMGTMIRWANDYQAFTTGAGEDMFSGTYTEAGHFGLTQYGMALLMKWHRQDPVSQKEIDRNNGIQATQGNRNPFIDYPCLAEYLWGEKAGETFNTAACCGSFEANFNVGSDGCAVCSTDPTIYSVAAQSFTTAPTTTAMQTITVKGANLTGDLTLALSGTNADLFTLSTTTVAQADATSGLSVTITYAPTATGTHTATITISGGGATDVTATLTGECADDTDSGDSGNDNTGGSNAPTASALLMVGKPIVLENVKKNDIVCTGTTTLQVHISDLATSVSVTSGDTGVFTVDKASITPDEAAEGVTLTLTKVADGTATLTISGGVVKQAIGVTCK